MSEPSALPPVRPSAEGQTFAGESLFVRYVNFVKLPHTLFALPFALLGVLAASMTAPVTPRLVLLVVIAFSAARWAAMGFNRIADRAFDARNPRTMERELPRGAITLGQAWASVLAASAIFMLAAGALNRLCLLLSPVALAWILTYSLSQAIHLVAAPLAGPQPGDRAGRRIPRGDGTVERAGLAASRGGARGRDLGGRVRHLLRPPR